MTERNDTSFVYVTYIAAKQDQVWNAIIDPKFTRSYWEHDNVSDWKPGSTWEHRGLDDTRKLDIVGKVIEFTPPQRMVITWASPADAADPSAHSQVTLQLEPVDDMVRLTVTHEGLVPGSNMLRGISNGWPRVLASLKTLLETGKPLNTWAKNKQTN